MQPPRREAGKRRLVTAFLVGLISAGAFSPAGFGSGAVEVHRAPATIEERVFDPEHLPDPPPPIPPGLKAVTHWDYRCDAFINVKYLNDDTTPGGVHALVRVNTFDINLHLPMVIWLPKGYSPKLKEHEYGHTRIDRDIYDHAEAAAEEAGQALIGQEFDGEGPTLKDAREAAMQKAIKALCDNYHERTKAIARELGDYYDRLTDHGRNDYSTDRAVEQTIARVEATYSKHSGFWQRR